MWAVGPKILTFWGNIGGGAVGLCVFGGDGFVRVFEALLLCFGFGIFGLGRNLHRLFLGLNFCFLKLQNFPLIFDDHAFLDEVKI